jgi:hypothetical protein
MELSLTQDLTNQRITNLEKFSESEFLRRELKLNFKRVVPGDVDVQSGVKAILTDDVSLWRSLLLRLPPKSVVLFLIGNEYYNLRIFRTIDEYSCIKKVFAQYLTDHYPKLPLTLILKTILSDPEILFLKPFYSSAARAFRVARRLKHIGLSTPTKLLPLGYTDRFVGELTQMVDIDPFESLIGNAKLRFKREQKHSIVFRGQLGSWYRRRVINSFQSQPKALISPYKGWGGSGVSVNSSYIELMLSSPFSLCPPGNLCNETPRYLESVALYRVPIVSAKSIQDWNNYKHWVDGISKDYRHSPHMTIFKKLSRLSDIDLRALSLDINEYEKKRLQKLKSEIDSALS